MPPVHQVNIITSQKFPSKGHHATFVTSVRPQSAILTPDSDVKVTLTIFAPDYVPAGSRILITLTVREKASRPTTVTSSVRPKQGLKRFYFSVTNWPLSHIDQEAPECQSKFICHTINQDCTDLEVKGSKVKGHDESKCSLKTWTAKIQLRDEISGLKFVKQLFDLDLGQQGLVEVGLIGDTDNVTLAVAGSCCNTNELVLNVTDVAGNARLCRASVNKASDLFFKPSSSFMTLSMALFIAVTIYL